MEKKEFFTRIVVDKDVPADISLKLSGRGIESISHKDSASDKEVLKFAVKNRAPLLTKDEDFREQHKIMLDKDKEPAHSGILIDNQMHLRDWNLVADTVKQMLDNIPEESMKNNIWRVSDFYGVL